MSLTGDSWDAAVSAWAHAQRDITALVQIGSRVQKAGAVDAWSDYDYQVITKYPKKYADGAFARELGPCWACGPQLSFGNATKVTAVYEGALEADFVILRNLEVLIAFFALSWPGTEGSWPRPLYRGVRDLRIVAAPGWKVIKGGASWEERYSRITPVANVLSAPEFAALCEDFWIQAVWAAKKAARGEFVACQRALHEKLVEHCLRIFQEEALIEGRRSYPLGRRAENWLTRGQSETLSNGTRPDRASLLQALARLADDFARSSTAVAAANHWRLEGYSEIRGWLAANGAVAG